MVGLVPATCVRLRGCHGPSAARPALTNRAQENAGRFGRDDSPGKCVPESPGSLHESNSTERCGLAAWTR